MKLDKMELQQLTPCSPTCSSLDQTDDWPSHESPVFNGNQCIWRVLKMFEILHLAGPSGDQPKCDSAQPKGQRSKSQRVDAILTANRMAMETVSLALSCSCARNPTIYSLIVIIVHQVLGSYCKLSAESLSAYMAQGHEDRASTSSATSSVSSAQPQHSSVGTAFDVPFAIGGYVLKQAERESIFKHVLRSEIEKMGGLITSLNDFHPVDDPLQEPFKVFIASLIEIQRHGLQ